MAPEVDVTLHLECWEDELSQAQKAAYERAEKEHNEIRNKLKEIVQETGGKNIFSGQVFTAYQVLGPVPGLEQIAKPVTSLTRKKPLAPSPRTTMSTSSPEPSTSGRRRSRRSDHPAEGETEPAEVGSNDDDDYIPLSKRMKQKDKTTKDSPGLKKLREDKTPNLDMRTKQAKSLATNSKAAAISVRPTEFNSIGGLQVGSEKDKKRPSSESPAVVDLTTEDTAKPSADSREISFSKIQGKTFPSLVVLARPSLRVPDKATTDRPQLDTKVKNVLVHPAPKFTEWLIQQGLIKSEQSCQVHKEKPLKLGMYSDTSKFPYSGGYFWISDCCPTRFTSVFNGSLFESCPHPPSVILKLIYHWACQTSISNVTSWVKVDNVYLKGFYTLLRSVCTLALCRHMKLLGGTNKCIEIGVISLGTTTQDGQQRQVKVEVLGVLDQETKTLRLRAVEPLMDGDRSYKKRFSKILEPLSDWVDKESTILTDLTVDKGTLIGMGYRTVQQVSPAEASGQNSNANVMDYLRRIVPRMFQNTLSLLSRQIIQQFLNELVWRELYGNSPGSTFDNIVKHLSEEAKIDTQEGLMTRLNKAAADPFKQWEIVSDVPSPVKTPGKRGRKPKDRSITDTPSASSDVPVPVDVPDQPEPPKKIILKKVKREEETAAIAAVAAAAPLATPASYKKANGTKLRKNETVSLESYYYGSAGGSELKESASPCVDFHVPCPECPTLTFQSNVDLLDHLLRHANPSPTSVTECQIVQCRVCLECVADEDELNKHQMQKHPLESKGSFAKTCSCLICEQRFSAITVLVGHLQKTHNQLEMPYRCAGCDFRSSVHRITVEHFYDQHQGTGLLQCPYCLKMACVYRNANVMLEGNESSSQSVALMENVKMFLEHLRKHSDRMISKRCNKCALSFLSKGAHKFHHVFSHVANNIAGQDMKPISKHETKIFTPQKKIKYARELMNLYKMVQPLGKLVLNMESGCVCLECKNDFDEFNHIIGMVQCSSCPFRTACLPSVVNHAAICAASASSAREHPVVRLQQEMHCICGFSSFDGNALARHLVACERGVAVYSSVEAAQANETERNMLDMLGLVRRDEEEDSCVSRPQQTGDKGQPSADGENVYESHDNIVSNTSGGTSYDPSQSLYNIAGAGEQHFNTQLSFDDLGPPSVLQAQDNDRTPQLKDDYQSLATPRVPDQADY